MFDILFRNAKVIDGTGNPWFYGDVGVEGGTVAAVLPPGSTARARRVARRLRTGNVHLNGAPVDTAAANAAPDAIMAESAAQAGATAEAPADFGKTINVTTPLLNVDLSPTGGVIKELELSKFTQKLGEPGKVRLIAVGFGEAATAVNNATVAIDPTAKVFPGHSSEGG